MLEYNYSIYKEVIATEDLEELFLKIYSASVCNLPCDIKELTTEQWSGLYRLSQIHAASALIYPTVDKITAKDNSQKSIKAAWKSSFKLYFLRQAAIYDELKKITEILNDNNIYPVLLKGPYLARFYPEPCARVSGDIDLLIEKNKIETTEKILIELCNSKVKSKSEGTNTYIVNNTLYLEVHITAFAEKHGKFFKEFSDYNIFSGTNMCKEKILDIEFVVPNCSDMFIYLICHMAQHFVSSGFGIRQMSDLGLFIQHYSDALDIRYINDILKRLDLYTFAQVCIFTCVKYFYIIDKFVEIDKNKLNSLCEKLLSDMLSGGVFGYSTEERKQSGYIVKEAFKKDKNSRAASKLGGIIIKLFPPYNIMASRFEYCKKYPFLLPIAWLNRIFDYIGLKHVKNTNYIKSFKNISDIAEQRKELLKELDML